MVAIPYEAYYGHHSRVYQFVKYHIWTGSSAYVTCPSAMTDGAARLLSRHLLDPDLPLEQQRVFREAYKNLISRDPSRAWTSGQWMTERSGGSDVRGTETIATIAPTNDVTENAVCAADADGLALGPYSINGFKWFSSATDANMAILLAKTPAGISTFFAPMRRCASKSHDHDYAAPSAQECEMNGVNIQRLKPKLGTRPVPTAELVLRDARAWMVGKDGHGVREIATILNITRIHTAVSALGLWGRGLAISRAFARVRKVEGGKLLPDVPAHVRTLAENTVNYAAMMHLGFFTVSLLGICEHPSKLDSHTYAESALVADVGQAAALFRLLTAVTKAQCSKMSIIGLQECMESLGGVGYLEDEQEFNVARLFRDANVNSIWEGTTDVMATDVVRVMKGRESEKIRKSLNNWVCDTIKHWNGEWKAAEELVRAELGTLEEMWLGWSADELKYKGRAILKSLAWIVAAVLMVKDARRDQDVVAAEMARRWIAQKGIEVWRSGTTKDWKDVALLDREIVFGADEKMNRARL
jgi:alkylation response protein AidB-like acyl-CoA dehydrogenase